MTRRHTFGLPALAIGLALLAGPAPAADVTLQETPMLQPLVSEGKLPPVAERVPQVPKVVPADGRMRTVGRHGGELRTLIGRAKDVRLLTVYGYARLVGYDETFTLQPDLAQSVSVEEGRIFTLRLRPGHRWSDGHPFTSEDFRYWWEDVANNPELSPSGPPNELLILGEKPVVEFPDALTIRYSWSRPNPHFLPRLAGAAPLFIFRPRHYLEQFHAKYAEPEALKQRAAAGNFRSWAALHNSLDDLYDADNPDLPSLQPWKVTTRPPANRFVAERNPYFHRVDPEGRQLPYIDRVLLTSASAGLIPAKTGAGESDLQARGLSFADFTFLKQNEGQAGYRTLLWRTAKGSHFALYPNLNANDPVWRRLLRDVRFRRALSLAIDRTGINQSLFFGLALEGNNTALPGSPLHQPGLMTRWAGYDPKQAAKLLDEIGLKERNSEGIRLLPDGRPLEIVVETAGEDSEQADILELIRESWHRVAVKLFIKPSQREVLRNRVFSGETQMSVWSGFETGLPTPEMSPAELAPTMQISLQWPKWGQFHETGGQAGEPVDMPEAEELFALHRAWLVTTDAEERRRIWTRMLEIHAEQQFVIGVVAGVQQPVVVDKRLRNIPDEGIFNWDPGAQFGVYRPDMFWFASAGR